MYGGDGAAQVVVGAGISGAGGTILRDFLVGAAWGGGGREGDVVVGVVLGAGVQFGGDVRYADVL